MVEGDTLYLRRIYAYILELYVGEMHPACNSVLITGQLL